MSDFTKIQTIQNYVQDHIYNGGEGEILDGETCQDVERGLAGNNPGVCRHYALAVQDLLTAAGFKAKILTGSLRSGLGHVWNKVKLNDEWYNLDAFWDDTDKAGERQYDCSN
jgi:transglutaminase-like putative cysteine protease